MTREQEANTSQDTKRRYHNPIEKSYATLMETSEESGGERTLIEVEVAPGGGTPPHYHKTYDEHFEVVEGELEVLLGKERHTLRPGQKGVAPKNTLHCFKNPTEGPTTFLVELRPGSAGFEKAMKAAYGLAADGRTYADGTPKSLYQLAVILEWSEIRLPGVEGLLEPLFRLLAKRARAKGTDRELEETYCR